MITIETLKRLIVTKQELTAKASEYGFKDLKIFCSPYENTKDTIYIVGTYQQGTATGELVKSKSIEEVLHGILNNPVSFWDKSAVALSKEAIAESKSIENLDQLVSYFIDTIIPYSTNAEVSDNEKSEIRSYCESIQKQASTRNVSSVTSVQSAQTLPLSSSSISPTTITSVFLQQIKTSVIKKKQDLSPEEKITEQLKKSLNQLLDQIMHDASTTGCTNFSVEKAAEQVILQRKQSPQTNVDTIDYRG